MALIALPTSDNKVDGLVTFAAANAGGDAYKNDEDTFLMVENTSGAARTITITAQISEVFVPGVGTLAVGNLTLVFAGDGIGVLHANKAIYTNQSNGETPVAVDTAAGVAYAVRRLKRLN